MLQKVYIHLEAHTGIQLRLIQILNLPYNNMVNLKKKPRLNKCELRTLNFNVLSY